MPTLEETLSNIASEVSQISSDLSEIGNATAIKAGLVNISDNNTPDDNSVPTVAFLKERNILGESGEAAGGLPQAQLEQVAALPAAEILNALAALPANLSALAGRIIAVNSAGNGYEIIVAPSGSGGGNTLPVSIVINRFTGNGTTTQFTLSQSPANSNALDISISGISIDPAIYSVSGAILTFTDAPPVTETNGIVVRHLGTVAALADGSITLPKIANGTPGKYLKFNATTGVIEETDIVATVADNSIGTAKLVNKNVTLAKIADGTPGKFLKFNSSTGVIEETDIVTTTNALILLQTQIATGGASSITFGSTHLTSTYKKYIIDLIDVVTSADGGYIEFVVSEDNGATYKGGSDYNSGGMSITTGGTTITGYAQANVGKVDINHQGIGNALGESLNATITMFNPAGTTKHKSFFMDITNQNSNGDTCRYAGNASYKGTVNAINNIKIYTNSGQPIFGTFKLYGIL